MHTWHAPAAHPQAKRQYLVVSGGCALADGHAKYSESVDEGGIDRVQGTLGRGHGAGLRAAMSRLYVLDVEGMRWFVAPVADDGARDCVGVKHALVPLAAQHGGHGDFLMVCCCLASDSRSCDAMPCVL